MLDIEDQITNALTDSGLCIRGSFAGYLQHPEFDLDRAYMIVLIGHVGGAFWNVFKQNRKRSDHALDDWTRQIMSPIERRLGCKAIFPSDLPYQPFQQWAKVAQGLAQSPLGLLIDGECGLWHAYRSALIFPTIWDRPKPPPAPNPCVKCRTKPCRSACPVGAFDGKVYNGEACRAYLAQAANACDQKGCLARQSCPVGREFSYSRDQQIFHMKAFLRG